jgi:hypothetical protein
MRPGNNLSLPGRAGLIFLAMPPAARAGFNDVMVSRQLGSMPLRYRHRHWIALIALLGLLFQQLAMASYACPLDSGGTDQVTSQTPPCHSPGAADKSRCHQHCHPLAQSSDHAAVPAVPPALLPPTTWLRHSVAAVGRATIASRNVATHHSAPPLTVQLCTFQI